MAMTSTSDPSSVPHVQYQTKSARKRISKTKRVLVSVRLSAGGQGRNTLPTGMMAMGYDRPGMMESPVSRSWSSTREAIILSPRPAFRAAS